VLASFAGAAAFAQTLGSAPMRERWSAQEAANIAAMRLSQQGPRPVDASNRHELRADAAALGRALFHDTRLSGNGQVACASCHSADRQFQDGRPLGQGIGTGSRRTMPVMGAAHAPFLFWDGRKDSAWSQALGPLEDGAEHGANRMQLARRIAVHYRDRYEAVFGMLPDLSGLPEHASPLGTPAERTAWAQIPEARRDAVNRVFANIGKSIAAFERGIAYGASRFDRYAEAVATGDRRGQEVFSPQEARGLRVFLTTGQCATCHNGPLLTDHAFHNTGVPPADASRPDRGRADGVRKLLQDEFNCLGRYSDAKHGQCGELQFIAAGDPGQLAAFRTPSLRNVAERAPYMHAGQLATLQQVVAHYARSPRAVLGHSELAQPGEGHGDRQPIHMSAADMQDLVAFLGTLTGPIDQSR
jgi:cytochrome c peroxidase